jgi:hypothetical protein
MTTDLTLFKKNALTMNERFQRMMEDTDRIAGMGRTSRRISIRGGRFREIIGGDQQRVNSSGSMNVVIVRASRISRTYYEGTYDPEKTLRLAAGLRTLKSRPMMCLLRSACPASVPPVR